MPKNFIKFNKDSTCFNETVPLTSNILFYKINEPSICDNAFLNRTLPNFNTNKVTSIGENAYKDTTGFDKIFISKDITHIGSNAFSGTDINEIIFEPGVVTSHFDPSSFYGLSTEPLNVFYDSNNFTDHSFNYYTNLSSSDICLNDINEFCFAKTIDNQNWIKIDNNNSSLITSADISSTLTNNSSLKKTDFKNIIFSNQIQEISNNSFKDCSNLKILEFDVANNFTTIGDSVFQNDISLVKIIFPESITTIGKDAFKGCKNLEFIYFPLGTTADISCGSESFYDISQNLTVNFICTGGRNDHIKIWNTFDQVCDPSLTTIKYIFTYTGIQPDF